MLLALQRYFAGIKPVTIDGALYVLIALFGAALAELTSDDAYKYCSPYVLYYLKFATKLGLAGATALKMFRSTAYSEHLANTGAAPKP